MNELLRRYGAGLTALFAALTAVWLVGLVLAPDFFLFENSFRPLLPVDEVGGPKDVYNLQNYIGAFTDPQVWKLWLPFSWEPVIMPVAMPIRMQVFLHTILFSAMTTLLSFLLTYPVAYYLAKVARPRNLPILFLLLLIPLWVSEILRSFAWFIILAFRGPLNALLLGIGVIDEPIRWVTGFNSVILGLSYVYILFMLFPVYNSIQSLDTNQIEAADDLGAPWWRIHWRVVLPHAKPGIASGAVMVFMLSAGSLLVPTILGSPQSQWFTEVIQERFFGSADWNTGAAYAFLLLLLCIVFVLAMMRAFRVSLADIAK
jgi:spermidine/putrescine transport system permease protein